MARVNELFKYLNILYDYGETKKLDILRYLIECNFLVSKSDRVIISRRWIKFSGLSSREEFISSLLCWYPDLLNILLKIVYEEAVSIGRSGDSKVLFDFANSVPIFAKSILLLKDKEVFETEEIKNFYQMIFGGYPHYQLILSKLKIMQNAHEQIEVGCPGMGETPNEAWIRGRNIASQVDIEQLDVKNQYTLTPYKYIDFPVSREVYDVLSNPWKTFITVLCMIISEYEAEGFEGICIRPTDKDNAFSLQPLDIYVYNIKCREIRLGKLKDFTYEFCSDSGFSLFPDMAPDVDKIVFDMLENEKIAYKDGEYVLNTAFKDHIYSKDIIIKNRSRRFKNVLKDYIEKLRSSL